jgi:hypothetical protein
MREIKVDVRAFLIPGTLVRVKIIEEGWVSAIVSSNDDKLLSTTKIMDDQSLNLNGPGWFRGLKENNIQICPT